MRELKKIFLTGIFLGVLIIFSINFASSICCERTDDDGICVDVGDRANCNDLFRIDDTACESTEYCSTGTCVNNAEGTCMTSSSSACDPTHGGYWYGENYIENPDAIPACKVGCCFLSGGTSFIPRTTCNRMSADIEIQPDFRESMTFDECILSSGPTIEGACVFETDIGKGCTIETNEACLTLNREPHPGLLCSAPELGTICIMTERTRCEKGRNEVYFVDHCDNLANVYDSTKITDVDYWSYMEDPASENICGFGSANINNKTCGNCIYGDAGSTCGPARGTGVNPTYGDYICRNLSCIYNGVVKEHASSWCSQSIDYFEDAKPGDLSYRLYCYNGEIGWDLCGNTRDYLCREDAEAEEANCLINRWQDCVLYQDNSKDCLDIEKRDCRIEAGVSRKNESGDDILFLNYTYIYGEDGTLISESSEFIKAVCVARYPPGFNFWDPEAIVLGNSPEIIPAQVCSAASISSSAGYHKPLGVKWWAKEGKCFVECIEKCDAQVVLKPECRVACFEQCPDSESFMDKPIEGEFGLGYVDLNQDWATEIEGLCVSLGDCGVKSNYIARDSYYSWKDLFIGNNITKTSIPRADNYQ